MNWIADLAELIAARPGLDWKQSMASADALGQGRILRLGLSLAVDVLGAHLPESIAGSVRDDSSVATLAGRAKAWLYRDPSAPRAGNLSRSDFMIRSMDWRRDRLNWIWHHFITRFQFKG